MYSNTGIVFQPTEKTVSHKITQKQYLAFVNEFSCAHPRAEHNTSGNLELASRPALQSQISTVLAAVAGHCDTLNSPFPCHLADQAAPERHDTRMDANKDLCREGSDHHGCLFRCVCGAKN